MAATAFALLLGAACGDDATADGTGANTTSAGTENATETPPTGTVGDSTVGVDETSEPAETETPACSVTPWAAPSWETNAARSLALRAQLDTLIGDPTMRGAETGAVVVDDVSVLVDLWEAGDPSLAGVANPRFATLVDGAFQEFMDVLAAGEQDLMSEDLTMWMPGPDGGIWGGSSRGINEGGLEVRQLVDKGAFSGGVMYSYAVSLTEGDIDPGTIDAIAAIWGSNATLDPEMVTDAAGYSYQMGFHADMAEALTAAKAHAADGACTAERDAALVSFFRAWEQSMLARLVFYGNRAEGKLLMAADQSGFADVLHDLGEGLGVAVSFYGLPNPSGGPLSGGARTITDAELDAIADALRVDLDDLGASTTGLFLESLNEYEVALDAVEAVVMDVYGIDAATIQRYAMPTPG